MGQRLVDKTNFYLKVSSELSLVSIEIVDLEASVNVFIKKIIALVTELKTVSRLTLLL